MMVIINLFQVSSVFVNKSYRKEVPYLQKIQPKDPISLENLGHVSINGVQSFNLETNFIQFM